MGEKRFSMKGSTILEDGEEMSAWDCYELLNEQQAIIEHLTVEKFKENKRFTKLLSEQQATIEQLQDLCGKSDGENAKLRIENKQLQKELNDCEKFRYSVFKGMEKTLEEKKNDNGDEV